MNFTAPHTKVAYNSNNAWGFGGSSGTKYIFADNLYCIVGWAGTRHRGSFPHITVWHNGLQISDQNGLNTAIFERANEVINKVLEADKTTRVAKLPPGSILVGEKDDLTVLFDAGTQEYSVLKAGRPFVSKKFNYSDVSSYLS